MRGGSPGQRRRGGVPGVDETSESVAVYPPPVVAQTRTAGAYLDSLTPDLLRAWGHNFPAPGTFAGVWQATAAGNSTRRFLIPFWLPRPMTLSKLKNQMSSGHVGLGKRCWLAIYSAQLFAPTPRTRLWSSGIPVPLDTVDLSVDVGLTFEDTGLYFLFQQYESGVMGTISLNHLHHSCMPDLGHMANWNGSNQIHAASGWWSTGPNTHAFDAGTEPPSSFANFNGHSPMLGSTTYGANYPTWWGQWS